MREKEAFVLKVVAEIILSILKSQYLEWRFDSTYLLLIATYPLSTDLGSLLNILFLVQAENDILKSQSVPRYRYRYRFRFRFFTKSHVLYKAIIKADF